MKQEGTLHRPAFYSSLQPDFSLALRHFGDSVSRSAPFFDLPQTGVQPAGRLDSSVVEILPKMTQAGRGNEHLFVREKVRTRPKSEQNHQVRTHLRIRVGMVKTADFSRFPFPKMRFSVVLTPSGYNSESRKTFSEIEFSEGRNPQESQYLCGLAGYDGHPSIFRKGKVFRKTFPKTRFPRFKFVGNGINFGNGKRFLGKFTVRKADRHQPVFWPKLASAGRKLKYHEANFSIWANGRGSENPNWSTAGARGSRGSGRLVWAPRGKSVD